MTTIQLQRQGVSNTLRGWFAPCQHGEKWHVEIGDYQGKTWKVEVNFPNCEHCHGSRRGQIAWHNYPSYKIDRDVDMVKRRLTMELSRLLKDRVEFAPHVEAYMAYTEAELRIWPHLKDDIYVLTASYEPETDTIRHEPSNICLIAFKGPKYANLAMDAAAAKYSEQITRAYVEFMKDHVQRDGEKAAKNWLAWLLSAYIRDAHPEEQPVVSSSPTRASLAAS
jgi:hypothetical protein